MCATQDCKAPSTGKSKYCDPHKAVAREAWLAMIAAKSDEKEARDQKWADLHLEADRAGRAAAEAVRPVPMVVQQHAHPLVDSSPVVKQWYEPEGVCGFAWVRVNHGNSSFAIWAVKKGVMRKSSQGGVMRWVRDYGQSMQRKEAYAVAYADVLRANGIAKAYAGSRMD